jgi:threonine dehydrogenase-like Zn-dependent dehydrogenase
LEPNAQANLAKIPDDLRDEQVILLADIASTGISAAESADLQIGDTVAALEEHCRAWVCIPANFPYL